VHKIISFVMPLSAT